VGYGLRYEIVNFFLGVNWVFQYEIGMLLNLYEASIGHFVWFGNVKLKDNVVCVMQTNWVNPIFDGRHPNMNLVKGLINP